jgi:hypothetical protein
MSCIDLRQRFGKRYRITRDPAYFAEYGKGARTPDPWYWIIPCRNGHFYPWGNTRLAASVDGHPLIGAALKRLTCCELVQDGSDGQTFVFEAEHFADVAKIMRPHRRRQVSEDQRQQLRARMIAINSQINPGLSAHLPQPQPFLDSQAV